MSRFGRLSVLLPVTMILGGCAEMTHLTRSRDLVANNGRSEAVLIDAKQRALFSMDAVGTAWGPMICAEPSPDALSAIAASQGLNVATPGGTNVGQSLSVAEAAGMIGLRTQSIQLLRDHMYRVCEGAMGQRLTNADVQMLHRRFQTIMVGILAIEQLTGAVRAPSVVLGGSASIGSAELIEKLTTQKVAQLEARDKAAAQVGDAEKALATADGDVASAQTALSAADEAGKAAAQTALDKAKATQVTRTNELKSAKEALASREEALKATERALALAMTGTATASASGSVFEPDGNRLDSATMTKVAEVIGNIVDQTFQQGYSGDVCYAMFSQVIVRDANSPLHPQALEILRVCNELLRGGTIKL